MRPSTVADAAVSAWPSTCPPNTCGLPMSRLSPRNRLTSSCSSSSSCSRSARRWSMAGCLSSSLNTPCIRALWPGKVHRYLYSAPFFRLDAGKVTLSLSPPPTILVCASTRLSPAADVVARQPGAHAGVGHRREVGRVHQHPVVAHGFLGQLAGVMQRDGDLLAGRPATDSSCLSYCIWSLPVISSLHGVGVRVQRQGEGAQQRGGGEQVAHACHHETPC